MGFPRNQTSITFSSMLRFWLRSQFAVTVGTFKVVVHVEWFTNFGIFETEFFPKAPARRPGSVLDKFCQ